MNNEKVIYEEKNGIIVSNSIVEYILKEGVWALYGKETKNAEYELLNVGKCVDVGKEIIYDLGCLHFVPFREDGTNPYFNQLNVNCKFNYKTNQTQEYLYPYLLTKYDAFKFIFVHNQADPQFETEYAIQNNAKYWRNGSPYGVKKILNLTSKRMQVIGDLFLNGGEIYTEKDLIQIINSKLGYDTSRSKRLINDCVNVGFLIPTDDEEYTR